MKVRVCTLMHSVALWDWTSESMSGVHTHTKCRHLPIKHFKNWHMDRISHDNGRSITATATRTHPVLFASIRLLHLRVLFCSLLSAKSHASQFRWSTLVSIQTSCTTSSDRHTLGAHKFSQSSVRLFINFRFLTSLVYLQTRLKRTTGSVAEKGRYIESQRWCFTTTKSLLFKWRRVKWLQDEWGSLYVRACDTPLYSP